MLKEVNEKKPLSKNLKNQTCPEDIYKAFLKPYKPKYIDSLSQASERVVQAFSSIKKKAPLAVQIADSLISSAGELDLEHGLRLEYENLPLIFNSQDAKLGISGAINKQRVKFLGK